MNLPIYGRRLIPSSLIYRPGTTYSNTIPRLFARHRVETGLPPDTRPTEEWLQAVREAVPPVKGEFRKVRLVMDTALVNLKMGDIGGFPVLLPCGHVPQPRRGPPFPGGCDHPP